MLLIAFQSLNAQQQTKQITGKVLEEGTDLPLPGVSITVKGTASGVILYISEKLTM